LRKTLVALVAAASLLVSAMPAAADSSQPAGPAAINPAQASGLALDPGIAPADASPSGQPLPRGDMPGWHQVFADDFTSTVPIGSFPTAVSDTWSAYQNGWPDTTHNGTYMPSQVVSQHDGVLDMYIHTVGGVHMVSALLPKIPGAPGGEDGLQAGRYAVRFKSDPIQGYKTAWLLWPDSGKWPADGEIDFPEGNLDGAISAFVHHQFGSSGRDQDWYGTAASYGGWHTAVIERTSSSVKFYLDDQLVGQSTSRLPSTAMHWVLQTETTLDGSIPSDSAAGHVLVDWVAVYTPA